MYISNSKNKITSELKSFIKRNLEELKEVKNKSWEFLEYEYRDDADKQGVEERVVVSNRVTGTKYRVWFYHNSHGSAMRKIYD